MTLPRISVVTPSYNQARYLEESIRSVLCQEYPNLEYIVIDGGSSDGSVGIIDKYRSLLARAVSEPDRGQAHAVNKGMSMAGGDILAFLNSDDLYLPGALYSAARYFVDHPDVEMIYAHAHRVDASGRVFERRVAPEFDLARLLRSCFIRQPTVFMRRSLWDRVGPFDESLHRCMDYDYWLRASRVTRPGPADFWAAADRFHADAKSSGPMADTLREETAAVDRFLEKSGISQSQPDLVRFALLPRLLILAGEASGATDAERAQSLARLASMAPPSLDELVEVIGGHDEYAGSRYMASSTGIVERADVYHVLPPLVQGGIAGLETATEAQRRLSVLSRLRSAQSWGLPSRSFAVARALAREPWLIGSRPFWVQMARQSRAGRTLVPLVALARGRLVPPAQLWAGATTGQGKGGKLGL